jgi:ribosomal protein S18 acetylase RimI-like enzyme
MMDDEIMIQNGLPEQHRNQAAVIYYEAFSRKLVMLAVSRQKLTALLARLFNSQRAIIALTHEQCVGVVGLHYDQQFFTRTQLRIFTEELGWLRGLPGYLMFHAFEPAPRQDHLRIECLAVAPEARGKGIGSQLLSAVYTLAKKEGKTSVSLEVVDTNPDARRLYERQGFRVTRTMYYPYLSRIAGFSVAYVMVRPINGSG